MKVTILVFLSIITSNLALDLIDFERMYQKKLYLKVSKFGLKYPSKFNSRKGLSILAKSNYKMKDFAQASKNCAKGAIEFEMKFCYKILKKIKQIDPSSYFFGLASYYMEIGDFKKAFEKFYELLKLDPKNEQIRAKLTKMLFQTQKYSYAYEQIQHFSSVPSSLSKENKKLLSFKKSYTKMFTHSKRDANEVPISALYYYMMFNPSADQEKISILRTKIQKFSAYGNSEKESLWLANLFYFEGKYQAAQNFLKEIQNRLLSPQARLSGDALQTKLDQKLQKKVVKKQSVRRFKKSRLLSRVPQASLEYSDSEKENSRSYLSKLDLRPLDDSELALASTGNMQVLKD
ncbi:hypothetical protein MJH12_09330, partial [bacterium]|nr:hypothetical protein [bacterium]